MNLVVLPVCGDCLSNELQVSNTEHFETILKKMDKMALIMVDYVYIYARGLANVSFQSNISMNYCLAMQ